MDIRQIEYFSVIVREGSFSRAARKLHIGQPALSKQIQALERELGAELLDPLPGHLVERFREKHSQLGVEIVDALPMFLAEWAEEGRLDRGVFSHQPSFG